MSGVQEKAVTALPTRILGVIHQKLREEHVDKIGTAHCSAGVAGISFFYHRCGQDTDIVRREIHCSDSVHIDWFCLFVGLFFTAAVPGQIHHTKITKNAVYL